jgi:4-amino-4-deoxy-L-arabinose transferase-like glycosyltransferase
MNAEHRQPSPDRASVSIAPGLSPWSRVEILLLVFILAVVIFARVWKLEADPPLRLSNSSDVYTDAALYTFYAKEFVNTGDFNPVGDERFGIFLKSTVTPVAVAVFKILGVGLWQSNLVGVVFSLGALLCFYLFVRRIAGVAASLLFLLMAGLSYNLVFLGRQPFLEHAMAFWAFLSLVLVTYSKRQAVFLAAGFCLGLAMLFSKVHGIVFLFPFACMFAWRLKFDDARLPRLKSGQVVWYGLGVLAASLVWFFATYLPAPDQVVSFFQENTIELHGAPEGLQSIPDFLRKLLTFGYDTELFPRMVICALAAFVFICAVTYQLCRRKSYRDGMGWGNAGYLFIAAMVVAFVLSLMIWNYRPLRYQLILIYPLCAGTAILLANLWRAWGNVTDEKTPLVFWIAGAVIAVIPGYQMLAASQDMVGTDWWMTVSKYMVPVSGIILMVISSLALRLARRHGPPRRLTLIWIVTGILLFGCLFEDVRGYIDWTGRVAFTLRDIGRDVEMAVGPDALVTGPYAQVLTLENRVPALIHMFGTAHPDADLFRKFPITHLLVDGGNVIRLTEDYPDIIGAEEHICTYFSGEAKVRLMNVAAITGNPIAAAYRRTALEQGIVALRRGDTAFARAQTDAFFKAHAGSIAGGFLLFELSEQSGDVAGAEAALKKAIEFSPTSYVLKARLGRFYRDFARATGRRDLLDLAGRYYEEAVRLAPTAERTVDEYQRFLESRE